MTATAQSVFEEIRRLHEERQSGVLVLCGSGGERIDVFFHKGMVEAASSNTRGSRLGDYLVKAWNLLARDLDEARSDAQRRKILLGEAVVRRRLLPESDVVEAVRGQVMTLLQTALEKDYSVDSFTSERCLDYLLQAVESLKNDYSACSFTNSLKAHYAPARIGFPHLLLELARKEPLPVECEHDTGIMLRAGADLSAYPWSLPELSLLGELQHPNTVEALAKSTGMGVESVRRILGVFRGLKIIETVAGDAVPVAAGGESLMERSGAVVRASDFSFEQLIPIVTNALLNEKLEVARNESSFASEQFRSLKVHLSEAHAETALKVFTVSSPSAQDGKSLISTNLAFSFAQEPGRRVIVVDCDLRRPALERYLGVSSEPGLLQYLASGNAKPYCFVRRIENLYFMTAGGIAPNPIEILSMPRMRQLVENLKKDFDTVILDAPPFSPIADARIVTGMSDGLIMVLRRGKTTFGSADHAFNTVERKKLLGVVFNDVEGMIFNTYHDSGYYRYGGTQLYPGKDRLRKLKD